MSESSNTPPSTPDTMGAMLGAEPAPAAAPPAEAAGSADREASRDAQVLGLPATDKATASASAAARSYRTGEAERDKAGRFNGRKVEGTETLADADHSNPAEQDDDDERENDTGDRGEDEIEDAEDADESEEETDEDDDSFEDMAKLADELDGVELPATTPQATRRPAGSESGNASDQPALSDDAADDDEKPYTADELKEILDSEGRGAEIQARQYNLKLKERREAREAQKAKQPAQQAVDPAVVRRQVETEILPTFSKVIEQVPALRAVYGKAGTKLGAFTATQANAIESVIQKAVERQRKSAVKSPDKPLSLKKAIEITLAKEHADEFARVKQVGATKEKVTVERHNRKTLSPSGGGNTRRSSTDPTKEAISLAGAFRAGRK